MGLISTPALLLFLCVVHVSAFTSPHSDFRLRSTLSGSSLQGQRRRDDAGLSRIQSRQQLSLRMDLFHHASKLVGSHHHHPANHAMHHTLGKDLSKLFLKQIEASHHPAAVWLSKGWGGLSPVIKSLLLSMYPGDFFLFAFFQLTYKPALRFAYKLQCFFWKYLALGQPLPWEQSICYFMESRSSQLAKLMGCNYVVKLLCMVLAKIGFRIRSDFPDLLSRISYALYASHFLDQFKSKFLHIFFPALAENRRQSYVVKRSTSFIILLIGVLVACEMVSTYLKVPLSSTLAFGGVGGLALGLSARDIAANFLGGLLLLFNEPFVPGDMVTFRSGGGEIIGRVERVGWGQTRLRGRDTRPTYIPNSAFVQTAVTNMERITHRKFEAIVPIRFQDDIVMQEVLGKIKESLRTIPKLDVLSMPFRVNFIKFGSYSLEIEITCYFATKSIDEFLGLQQAANMEILKAIRECGAQLALPTTQLEWTGGMGGVGGGVSGIASQLIEEGVASLSSSSSASSSASYASANRAGTSSQSRLVTKQPNAASTTTTAASPSTLSLPPLSSSSSSSSSSSTTPLTPPLTSSAVLSSTSSSPIAPPPPLSTVQQKARAAVAAVTASMQAQAIATSTAKTTPAPATTTTTFFDASISASGSASGSSTPSRLNTQSTPSNLSIPPPSSSSSSSSTVSSLSPATSLPYKPQPRKDVIVVGDDTVASALNGTKLSKSIITSPPTSTSTSTSTPTSGSGSNTGRGTTNASHVGSGQSLIPNRNTGNLAPNPNPNTNANIVPATSTSTSTSAKPITQPQPVSVPASPAIITSNPNPNLNPNPIPDTSYSELWNPIPEKDIFGTDEPQPF